METRRCGAERAGSLRGRNRRGQKAGVGDSGGIRRLLEKQTPFIER